MDENNGYSENLKPKGDFKYYYDKSTGLFHRTDCPKCTSDITMIQGFGSLKGCLKRKLVPCECCASDAQEPKTATAPKSKSRIAPAPIKLMYSINSRKKLIHHYGCVVLKRIKPQNIKFFTDAAEARKQGYKQCPHCNLVESMLIKEEDKTEKYCCENGLKLTLKDGAIYIGSRHDFWRIILNDQTGQLMLYHRNIQNRKNPIFIPGLPRYHVQNFSSTTLLGYLKYIVQHDQYRDGTQPKPQDLPARKSGNKPPAKHGKKGKKLAKNQKNKQKKQSVAKVLAIIDEMEALRR
ncbi:MAG: hypothetical protein II875_13520 [Clostridia bacterium]|nr:hypothetical protein [Clostridia bacterium]